MTFWDWVIVAVLAAVLAAAFLGTVRWAWARRAEFAKERRAVQAWIAGFGERRRSRSHAALVEEVLARAEALRLPPGKDLPVSVDGSRPALIRFHPTGRTFAMFPDRASYQAAWQRGDVNPSEAHFGRVPRPVDRWTDEKLRGWLEKHEAPGPAGSEGA